MSGDEPEDVSQAKYIFQFLSANQAETENIEKAGQVYWVPLSEIANIDTHGRMTVKTQQYLAALKLSADSDDGMRLSNNVSTASFITRLNELLKKNKESYREAALSSGLDHQAVLRILAGQQPSMTNCILLADHFRINANEFLALAGWPTLKAFEIQAFNQEQLPPEVVEVALSLAKVSNPGIRKDAAAAFLALINHCINQS